MVTAADPEPPYPSQADLEAMSWRSSGPPSRRRVVVLGNTTPSVSPTGACHTTSSVPRHTAVGGGLRMSLRRFLRRQAPDPATVVAERDTQEWPAPEPMGDHRFDVMPDDFAHPPAVPVPPEYEQLAAWLEGMTPERREVLRESETANGYPLWVKKWEECPAGWVVFKALCEEAFEEIDAGRPAVLRILEINRDPEPN